MARGEEDFDYSYVFSSASNELHAPKADEHLKAEAVGAQRTPSRVEPSSSSLCRAAAAAIAVAVAVDAAVTTSTLRMQF